MDDLRAAIVEGIGNIAPEADAMAVPDDADLREALDLYSMDIFNGLPHPRPCGHRAGRLDDSALKVDRGAAFA